jgi:hypothetical protein
MNESRFNPTIHESDECLNCGNPKALGLCQACRSTHEHEIYTQRIEEQRKREISPKVRDITHLKEKPVEIPKDPEGRPLYGPGSKNWENQRSQLTKRKTG